MPDVQYVPKLPDDTVNAPQTNPLGTAAKLSLSLALIGMAVYWIVGAVINYAVERVTLEQERQLARLFRVEMRASDTNTTYFQSVTDRLAACARLPYPIRVHIMEEKEPNAFAVPGGEIYITTGILAKMESENELGFILGHELGHFKHRDHLRSLGLRLILGLVGMVLGGDYGVAGNLTIGIGSARYSQSAELAADAFGLEMMQCAYGTVTDATKMFEKMDEGDEWRYFLATHPGFEKRIEQMRELIETRGYDTTKKALPLRTRGHDTQSSGSR
jgi:Zn-dependent protease with chaperone function